MNFLKRVGIIVIFAVVLSLLSSSFLVVTIADRAIIIGLGIDRQGDEYVVTSEVLTGSPSSSETGNGNSFSKVISGSGSTVALAMQNIYNKTGQLPSLGQCCIVLLGKSVYLQENLSTLLDYFLFSDAFKDNTIVACFEGEAKDSFNYVTTLTTSPSFAMLQLLQGSDGRTGLPQNHLEKFMYKQYGNLSDSSFLNLVKFLPDEQTNDAQTKHTQGDFYSDSIALFSHYTYQGELSGKALDGFNLLMDKSAVCDYVVNDGGVRGINAPVATVGLLSKSVDKEISIDDDGKINFKIDCNVRVDRLRTDETGELFILQNHKDDKVNTEMKREIEATIQEQIEAAFGVSAQLKCDFLELSNQLYRSYGKAYSLLLQANPLLPFEAQLEINVVAEQ